MLRSTYINNMLFGLLVLLALHTNPIVFGAVTDLCDTSPDICELVTGCYADKTSRDGSCNINWWAYVPTGEYKCPQEGCPLYIWLHGTMEANARDPESDIMQLEMLKRGYIAVQVGYDDDMFGYMNSPGCEGGYFYQGILDKAQAIFDGNDENSVVSQICDGPDALANCDLGVAVHGYSQGAQLGSLAGNYDKRVSAALLFGNGNYQTFLRGDYSCLNNENIALPRERRRSITGSNDGVFGDGTVAGAMKQQKETSGYDCGDSLKCFSHVPNEVFDTYLGGDAMIEDTGGYYLISGEEYDAAIENVKAETGADDLVALSHWDASAERGYPSSFLPQSAEVATPSGGEGVGHWFFHQFISDAYDDDQGGFIGLDDYIWGIPQSLDWLDRTARKTAAQPSAASVEESNNVYDASLPSMSMSMSIDGEDI